MPPKPKTLTDPQDATDAGRALCPNQARLQRLRIRSLGKVERPAYRGGNGYPRLEGDA